MDTNWQQINIPKDAFLSLLNNKFISDVKFRFADGRTIFAHSFVLCCRSGEYYNSFVANVGVSKLIEVNDITYEELYQFLRHLYTKDCQINKTTLGGMMKLSKQHSLPELETQCADVMFKEINVSNACGFLETSIESGWGNVTDKVTDYIAENYFATINHKSFLKVSNRTLEIILGLDPISDNNEFKIFERIMTWAAQACLADGIKSTGSTKRAKLGHNLKLIRFGAMSATEFGKCQDLEPGLFEDREKLSIFTSQTTGQRCLSGFSNKKRELKKPLDSVEFNNIGKSYYDGERRILFAFFTVSHAIKLEQIKLIQMDNIVEFKLQTPPKWLYWGTIYESYGPFTGSLNPKPTLEPNIKYCVHVEYSSDVNAIRSLSTEKQGSKSRRCEFHLASDWLWPTYKCIKELNFRE